MLLVPAFYIAVKRLAERRGRGSARVDYRRLSSHSGVRLMAHEFSST